MNQEIVKWTKIYKDLKLTLIELIKDLKIVIKLFIQWRYRQLSAGDKMKKRLGPKNWNKNYYFYFITRGKLSVIRCIIFSMAQNRF